MDGAPDVETPTDQPPESELFQLAHDAADASKSAMKTAISLRLKGFLAAAEYVSQSAEHMDQDTSIFQSLAKAFEIVSGALLGVGMNAMTSGFWGTVAGLFQGSLGLGFDAIQAAGQDQKLKFADFNAAFLGAIANAEMTVEESWKVPVLRSQIVNARYPHKAGAELEKSTRAIMRDAYRLQYATTLTSWMSQSRVGKPSSDDIGTLQLQVNFRDDGGYTIVGAEVPGMGPSLANGLLQEVPGGRSGSSTSLKLQDLLASKPSTRVVVHDEKGQALTWAAPALILEKDNEIRLHGVTKWGEARIGKDKAPIAYAHEFILKELAPRSMRQLGLGGSH